MLRLTKHFFSPDPAGGGEKPIPFVSPEEEFNKAETADFTKIPAKKDDAIADDTALTEEDKKILQPKGLTDQEKADLEKADKDKADPKKTDDGSGVDDEPEELNVDLTADDDNEINASFIDLAKDLGFEVADDSIEAFKKGFDEKLESVKVENIEKKYGEDGAALFMHLEAGGSLADIFDPIKPYYEMLMLSPDEKVAEAYRLEGKDEKWITDKIDQLKVDEKFDAVVLNINANLKKATDKIIQEQIDKSIESANNVKKNIFAQEDADNKKIVEELMLRETFNDMKISEAAKKTIKSRWEKGLYRKAFENDPKAVVDFIYNLEFGKIAHKKAKTDSSKEVKKEIADNLHNLDTAKEIKSAKAKTSKEGSEATGFDRWNAIDTEQVVRG